MPNANFHLRNISPDVMALLKDEASNQNISINSLILHYLERELGVVQRIKKPHFNDLDDLAGTWTEKDIKKFDEKTKCFEQVDKELWE